MSKAAELLALAMSMDCKCEGLERAVAKLREKGGDARDIVSLENQAIRGRYYIGVLHEAKAEMDADKAKIAELAAKLAAIQKAKQNPKTPQSEEAKMICKIVHRKESTEWSSAEIRAFLALKLTKSDHADLTLLLRYYEFERAKGEKGIHRRNLITFLNNYQGELDRAEEWQRTRPASRVVAGDPDGWREWLVSIGKAYVPYANGGVILKDEFKRRKGE